MCVQLKERVVGGETRNLDPAAPASVSLGGAAGSPAFLPPTGIGAAGRSPHENGGTVMALQGTELFPLQSTSQTKAPFYGSGGNRIFDLSLSHVPDKTGELEKAYTVVV